VLKKIQYGNALTIREIPKFGVPRRGGLNGHARSFRLTMKRFTIPRFGALLVLLLHGSAYGVAPLLDGKAAAGANSSVAHVEGETTATCVAHDEATCQLCRVAKTTMCVPPQHFAPATLLRSERSIGRAREHQVSIARTALHSRAPPAA
jgi:hypothetical protein